MKCPVCSKPMEQCDYFFRRMFRRLERKRREEKRIGKWSAIADRHAWIPFPAN